jgi:hypothetical protein
MIVLNPTNHATQMPTADKAVFCGPARLHPVTTYRQIKNAFIRT